MRIVGYADRLSVPAGSAVTFHVSAEHPAYRPDIVRLRRGGSPRHHTTLLEEPVPTELPATLPGRVQTTTSGSFVEAGPVGPLDAVGLAVWFLPTLLDERARPLLSVGDLALEVSAAGVALRRGGTVLAALGAPPTPRRWAFVCATVSDGGAVRLVLHRPDRPVPAAGPSGVDPADGASRADPAGVPADGDRGATAATVGTVHATGAADAAGAADPMGTPVAGVLRIGSDGSPGPGPGRTFNGKVARPVVASTAWPDATTEALASGADPLAVGAPAADAGGQADAAPSTLLDPATTSVLDLAADPAGNRVPDRGGLTGGGVVAHLPTRGAPGPFWTGAETDFRCAPSEFDALHLHDDDLADAGWEPDLTWTVPADLPSGVYALRVSAGEAVDRIPFVVTPAPGAQAAPVLVVLPTWTYLAYANWRTYAEYETERLAIYGEARGIDERDRWLTAHPEFGRSLYDVHTDGSGVCHTSRLRPIVNLRPDYYTPTTRGHRHYAQDLLLLDWLDRRGERYDVITDDEVHERGADAFAGYRVVLTGSHPEYCSARMLDAYASCTAHGGRLMYLGGNGFYQVTARHPVHRGALEIRRGHAGVATWVSDPGEEHLAATGEHGGLWRMRGRAPNVLAGVGFTAQGFDSGYPYVRGPGTDDPSVSWVFDGVSARVGEPFGGEGPGLGGAAGDELDRADVALGTPVHAVVLASSAGHSPKIALVPEEADRGYAAPPPGVHPKVRADLVLFGRPGGGAVFSVGSIAWSTAMTHADGDNDVSRITANVLDRFRDDPGPVTGEQQECR